MDFFDSFPAREPVAPPRRRPWWQRPDNVLPASVPGDALLIRTDSAAVWAGAVRVYPNGFQMSVRMVRREPPDGSPRHRPVHHFPPAPFEAVGTGTGLRLGIEYVDGRRDALGEGLASHHHFSDDEEERTLRIMDQGGGGDGTTWDAEVWVAPLPPDGPVTLVAVWPGAGATAECRAELDGAAIRAAAARTVTLWPPDEYEAEGGGQWGSVRIATTADDAGGKQAGGA